MKRTVKLSLLAFIAIVFVSFVSCVDEPVESIEPPKIIFNSPTADTIYTSIGETIVFDITFTSQSSMASLMTNPNVMGVDVSKDLINFNGSGSINENVEIRTKITNIVSKGMTFNISFIAQDHIGSSIENKVIVVQK